MDKVFQKFLRSGIELSVCLLYTSPEFVLFDMRTKHEYEANAFASHLIIDDDELIDLMKQDYDCLLYTSIFTSAAAFC